MVPAGADPDFVRPEAHTKSRRQTCGAAPRALQGPVHVRGPVLSASVAVWLLSLWKRWSLTLPLCASASVFLKWE